MSEELIRAACEAANCKYPDMEAAANFKREVTPSVVIGLIDGLRHANGIAAINDARANGAAETIQHLRDDIADLRANACQGGEAVATDAFVPGSLADLLFQLGEKGIGVSGGTHGDHWKVTTLYTHPADQVAEPDAELVRQCISEELEEWEGDYKFAATVALNSLSKRIDAKLASLEPKP